MNFQSKLLYRKEFPELAFVKKKLGFKPETLMIAMVDKKLNSSLKDLNFKDWLKDFDHKVELEAGEYLKSVSNYIEVMKDLLKWTQDHSRQSAAVVGIGGGSVGDFAGFCASTAKRGLPLVHIPSTYIAAMDSAHGGKTALNFEGFKNQIGTFYPAQGVLLSKACLDTLPREEILSAYGEMAKMALIQGGGLYNSLKKVEEVDAEGLWRNLKTVVGVKNAIVKKDPYEQKGLRFVLNLGHTTGHVFESLYGIPHGQAVGLGLRFTAEWSAEKGYLNGKVAADVLDTLDRVLVSKELLHSQMLEVHYDKGYSHNDWKHALQRDKKAQGDQSLNFVFLKGLGKPFVQKAKVSDILKEMQRQGWIE